MKHFNGINVGKGGTQGGFTIIELVVVILLLGILTATALPRFMDVTDEAHAAVVDAVAGGLGTATALYRAEFIAQGGTNTIVTGYTGVTASATTGYPNITSAADCVNAFDNMLQAGHPSIAAGSGASNAASTTILAAGGAASDAGANVDFVAYYDGTDDCIFVYVADDDANLADNHYVTLDRVTGDVENDIL